MAINGIWLRQLAQDQAGHPSLVWDDGAALGAAFGIADAANSTAPSGTSFLVFQPTSDSRVKVGSAPTSNDIKYVTDQIVTMRVRAGETVYVEAA
jgi:hypothetical protein